MEGLGKLVFLAPGAFCLGLSIALSFRCFASNLLYGPICLFGNLMAARTLHFK